MGADSLLLSAARPAPIRPGAKRMVLISRRTLRRASSKPSLHTVWELGGDVVDAVPPTELALDDADSTGGATNMSGWLWVRPTSFLPLRLLFGRRALQSRYAVLQPTGATSDGPPRLQLFAKSDMCELSEELLLLSPVQLQCLPNEGRHVRFALSAADAPPVEFVVDSEDERLRWMLALGETVCPGPPAPGSPVPGAASPVDSPARTMLSARHNSASADLYSYRNSWPQAPSPEAMPSPGVPSPCALRNSGRVRLGRSRVAEHYSMGSVLAQGEHFLVVEGVHISTNRPHSLKLISKNSQLKLQQHPQLPKADCERRATDAASHAAQRTPGPA